MASNNKPPKGWQCKRLDEIADIRFSSVDKHIHATETPVRLCNYMEVWKNPYIHKELDFMEGSATQQEIERFALQPGDVLLTKDSETRDEIAEPSLVREQIDGLVLGYHLALLRPNESQALGAFLAAQLRIPEFRAHFIRTASGVTRYGLSMETVASAEVWLPTPEVQRRIADILRATDDAIERTRAVIAQTRKLKTALLQDLLTNGLPGRHTEFATHPKVGRIPADWRVLRLDEIAKVERGKFTHRPRNEPRFYGGDIPFVQTSDVVNSGDYLREYSQTLNELGLSVSRLFPPNTILFVIAGSVGETTIASYEVAFPDSVVGITPHEGIDPLFLLRVLRYAHERMIRSATESAQANLSLELLQPIPLPLPDADERDAIMRLLRAVETRIEEESSRLRQLQEVKRALSQSLLTGDIRVPTKGGE